MDRRATTIERVIGGKPQPRHSSPALHAKVPTTGRAPSHQSRWIWSFAQRRCFALASPHTSTGLLSLEQLLRRILRASGKHQDAENLLQSAFLRRRGRTTRPRTDPPSPPRSASPSTARRWSPEPSLARPRRSSAASFRSGIGGTRTPNSSASAQKGLRRRRSSLRPASPTVSKRA